MINNRQAGRRRGRGGNNPGGGGGNGPRQGGGGRQDNGNRIDSRARGNAAQLLEKYRNLAADAQRQGDRVNTEYYLQFADHYFRVIADQRGRFEDQQPRRQQADFDGEGDEEFGDEGEPIRAGEQGERSDRQDRSRGDRPDREPQRMADQGDGRPERQERPRTDRQDREPRRVEGERPRRWERDERPRADERMLGDRGANDRGQADRGQVDRGQGERAQAERMQTDRGDDARSYDARANGHPVDAERADEPRAEPQIAGQRRADPPVTGEDLAARAETVLTADAPLQADVAPRRRGRPRREPVDAARPAESNGVDADRLPPSLGIAATGAAEGDGAEAQDAPRPVRRRRVRAAAPEAAAD